MNETKTTPWPWRAAYTAGHETHGQSVVYAEADGKDIAVIYDGKANARLIAAAPDLLAALCEIMDDVDLGIQAVGNINGKNARAAIAKAKGE